MQPDTSQRSNTHLELAARVTRLRRFFDVDMVARKDISAQDIVKYYKSSSIGYSLVHSRDGSIHMSLSRDGVYDPDGYRAQVDIVGEEIKRLSALAVLELGCGRGYNIVRLARNCPTTEFVGIDLSPRHVVMAKREAKSLSNVYIQVGDFESLTGLERPFDLAYSIESMCHARNPRRALAEVARVVRPGGKFLIVDAWRTDKGSSASKAESTAISLTEKSMAVANVVCLSEWRELCNAAGWNVMSIKDLNREVMPNLQRFERLADRVLRRPALARAISCVVPRDLAHNIIAGYLMAQSVRQGFHMYGQAVLQRQLHSKQPTG